MLGGLAAVSPSLPSRACPGKCLDLIQQARNPLKMAPPSASRSSSGLFLPHEGFANSGGLFLPELTREGEVRICVFCSSDVSCDGGGAHLREFGAV